MPSFLGPILAQAITLSVGNATEARAVIEEDVEYQGTTVPNATLGLRYKQLTLSMGYGVSIDVVPLDHEPRDISVFHGGFIATGYTHGRTTFGVTQAFGVGRLDFRARALSEAATTRARAPETGGQTGGETGVPSGPPSETPGTGTSAGPGVNEIAASPELVRYGTATTDVSVEHLYSRDIALRFGVGYGVSGPLDRESAESYQLVETNRASAAVVHRLSARATARGTLTGEYAASIDGGRAQLLTAEAGYGYAFTRRTSGELAGRLSGSRLPARSGAFVQYNVYPGFSASISSFSVVGRGRATFTASAASAPQMDLVVLAIDPRVTIDAGTSYELRRFSASLVIGSALSTAGEGSAGSLRSVTGQLGAGYQITEFLSVRSGVRAAWQTFEGETAIPLTYAAFLGLTIGFAIPITGSGG
jgi:hypothetical protein